MTSKSLGVLYSKRKIEKTERVPTMFGLIAVFLFVFLCSIGLFIADIKYGAL